MQKLRFAIINPCLFSSHFAFSYEGTEHHINHNAFHGSRNASNKSIKFLNFQNHLQFLHNEVSTYFYEET
jgi:hypothetical protein